MDEDDIAPLSHGLSTQHHICETATMALLKKDYQQRKRSLMQNEIEHGEKKVDYQVFVQYYFELYRLFLEPNNAPFGLNISSKLSKSFSSTFNMLRNDESSMDEQLFEKLWKEIRESAAHIYTLLRQSFWRFTSSRPTLPKHPDDQSITIV